MQALIDGDTLKGKHTWIDSSGYLAFSIGNQNQYHIHRHIAEKALGRKLLNRECVHHIDGNKQNNNPTNLVICPNDSYHLLLHARTDSLLDGYNPDVYGYCSDCKEYHLRDEFPKSKNRWNGIHNICKYKQNARRRGNVKYLERRRELRRERRVDV